MRVQSKIRSIFYEYVLYRRLVADYAVCAGDVTLLPVQLCFCRTCKSNLELGSLIQFTKRVHYINDTAGYPATYGINRSVGCLIVFLCGYNYSIWSERRILLKGGIILHYNKLNPYQYKFVWMCVWSLQRANVVTYTCCPQICSESC